MAIKNYDYGEVSLSSRWKYTEETDDTSDTYLILTSRPTSSSKTITFSLSDLPSGSIINKITLTWTPDSSRSNSYISSSFYGYRFGRTYAGDSTKGDYVSASEKTIDLTAQYNSSSKEVSATFYAHMSASLPSQQSYAGSGGAGQAGSNYAYVEWENITLTVDYTPYVKLSTPLVESSTITIKTTDSTIFTWGASSSTGSNIVSYYQIYKNGQALTTTTSTSYSITGLSVGSDSSAVFTVKAISDQSGYDSAVSNGFTVQCYKDFVMPSLLLYTNKNSTQSSTITVGASEKPSITAVWNLSSLGGTYDSIKSITFNSIVLSTNIESQPIGTISSTTTYTLSITMKSGYSGTSTATASIATVGNISFTSASTGMVGSSTTYSWSKASGATDYYFYLDGDIGDYSGTTTNTSINQNISNYVSNDHSFTFTVYPRANAPYGGYTQGEGIVASQTRVAKPAISGNISITGDTAVPSVYAYNTVNISITDASNYSRVTINASTQTSALKDFTNNSASTLSTSHNISSISEGTSITYTIKLYNSYGENSEYTYTIVRFQKPTVTITGVSESIGINNKSATINFTITHSPHSNNGNTRYYPEISYEGQTIRGEDVIYNNETSIQVPIDFQNSHSTLREGLSALYDALRGANGLPIGKPTLSFNIVVYDSNIGVNFSNRAFSSYNQVIDYRAYPTNPKLTISCGATYPSSKDTITLTSNASIVDAVGNTGGLIYTITRANPYATFTGASVQEILNTISSDTTYTYTLTASKQYKDGNTSTNSVPVSINVYRFTPPSFTVSNLRWEENTLKGTININDLGGSNNKIPNISYYDCTVREIGGSNLYTEVAARGDYSNNQVEQNFTYSNTVKEISLQVIVTAYSKSGILQQTVLGPFLVKPSGIPFSIRRNGVGVHVEKDFNPSTTDAAFKVIGNSDTDTIAEFSNGNNRESSNILLNLSGSKAYLSIQENEQKELYFAIIFE